MRRLLATVIAGYGLLVLLGWAFQSRLAFSPARTALPEPNEFGLSDGRRVAVVTADSVTLRGWYLPPRPPPVTTAPALLWLLDRGETVVSVGAVIRELRLPGLAVLALDHRGAGQSEGQASEAGLYRDAEAAWAFLASRPEVDRARIAVYGRGLGTAAALHVATARRVRAVVLEAPFIDAHALFHLHFWFLPPGVLRLELDNLSRARRLRAPLLVIHGTADRIVPIAMGRAVAEAGRARGVFAVAGAGHEDVYRVAGERYREVLQAFLSGWLSP